MKRSQGMIFLLLFLAAANLIAGVQEREGFNWEPLKSIAIQDRGRVKPFDTFARESALYISGKTHWGKIGASEMVFGWLVALEKEWKTEEFVRVDYEPLKKEIGLEIKKNYFTPEAISDLPELRRILREAFKKQSAKERLSQVEQKAQELDNKRSLLEAIVSGQAFHILPNPKGEHEEWFSLLELTQPGLPYTGEVSQKFAENLKSLIDAFMNRNASNWNTSIYNVQRLLKEEMAPGHYAKDSDLKMEMTYNSLRPFRWSWVVYTLSFCFFLGWFVSKKKILEKMGYGLLGIGFCLHTVGFILRCLISDRPPVTNMYESVIWVSWGALLFSGLIWFAYRRAIIPVAAMGFSILALVLADNLPFVLDPGIHPLVPVLRSNYWLTIHVLTITLSYAAFAVSLCMGNVNLGYYLFRPTDTEALHENSMYMYRAMQIGVVLLAAGTILGGVWADYSWGRFWGWDPKEVWALIALLLYIAVLHGRFTGWLKGFGFVATTVVSFLGVLTAWYGVNFVLGVGLHSYGFGSGGLGYVTTYILLQLGFIGAAYFRYVKAGKPGNNRVVPRTGI